MKTEKKNVTRIIFAAKYKISELTYSILSSSKSTNSGSEVKVFRLPKDFKKKETLVVCYSQRR